MAAFASPDLVLVAHCIHGDLQRLEETKIKIPYNDTAASLEQSLFNAGYHLSMPKPTTKKTNHDFQGHTTL
ncbi:hypothetical protein BDN72DRAFT_848843 [Pluteus cervinus]|uniref:Uncharacterized protein n=1 Tax=Pluteus cervinus TaxID=181527 RepID=A0ACD3A8T5_9AGAR|nr:hypothetical protein BDN72DRAFT_848843 [Pluteus cervinus]